MRSFITKRNSPTRKALAATSVFLGVVLAFTPAISGMQAESCATNYPSRYMGGEAEIIEAPNGALIYDKALDAVGQIVYTEPTVENLGDGIWVIGGYSIANFFVIEAPEGLIVYDTGDYAEEGRHVRRLIEEKISKQPIKAIIYSHSHYALGGGALVNNIWSFAGDDNRADVNQMLIQPFVNYNLGRGLAIGSVPIITANWEAPSGQEWTVPLDAQISQIIPIGKLPVNFLLGAYYNIEKPDNGADWSLRFQIALLFPK